MLTLTLRLLLWGARLDGIATGPLWQLGGVTLRLALGLDADPTGLIEPARQRLVRAQERTQFDSPEHQEELASLIEQLDQL